MNDDKSGANKPDKCEHKKWHYIHGNFSLKGYCIDCGQTLDKLDKLDKSGAENVKSFEAMRDEAADKYQDEDFKQNPNGYTVATYVNRGTAFEAGANWARQYFEAKLNDAETKLACVLVHHRKLETQLRETQERADALQLKYNEYSSSYEKLHAHSETLEKELLAAEVQLRQCGIGFYETQAKLAERDAEIERLKEQWKLNARSCMCAKYTEQITALTAASEGLVEALEFYIKRCGLLLAADITDEERKNNFTGYLGIKAIAKWREARK